MRKQSVDILDSADRFEDMLNWQLFKIDNAKVLYEPTKECGWVPGEPLFERARITFNSAINTIPVQDPTMSTNHRRPMLQLFDDNESLDTDDTSDIVGELNGYCPDCNVRWSSYETTGLELWCWMCNQGVLNFEECGYHYRDARRMPVSFQFLPLPQVDIVQWTQGEMFAALNEALSEAMRPMIQGFQNVGRTMRGLRANFAVRDEAVAFDVETFGYLTWNFPDRFDATDEEAWYRANPQADIRTIIDDHLSPAPILQARNFWTVRTRIEIPNNISWERDIPLPDPLFPEFRVPEHLAVRRDNNVSNRRNTNPRRPL